MTDRIEIRGIRCSGIHGVLEFERLSPQEFLVDALLFGDFAVACETDDLDKTVDYSKIVDLIRGVIEGEHSDLLENLAFKIADNIRSLILTSDVLVNEVRVKVTKTHPPIDNINAVSFDISLKVKRDVYLSIGSNLNNRLAYLRGACQQLPDMIAVSNLYNTAPEGENIETQGPYLNCVVRLYTDILPFELLDICHKLETEAGRRRFYKNSARTLDIDILTYGTLKLDDPVLTLPHPKMGERAFVIEPLLELMDSRENLESVVNLGTYKKSCKGVTKLGKLIL